LSAQGYPAKTVRIVVPVATGGATDILTRALAQRLANTWGQQMLVDNRPGGGSNVGFEVAAKSPADGYTLLMAQPAFTVNVSLYKKLGYDRCGILPRSRWRQPAPTCWSSIRPCRPIR